MTNPESSVLVWLQQVQLPCGATIDDLLEQAADGQAERMTEHQTGCVHCQAALREFSRIWAPVRAQAAEPVNLPHALSAAVQAKINKLVADVWYTLQLTNGGQIRIAARVVATLARAAARTVPGVRVAFGRNSTGRIARLVEKATLGHLHPHAAIGVLGRTAVIDLALAVKYGQPVDDIARQVQHRVIADLQNNVGLQDITVNVTVDDILT